MKRNHTACFGKWRVFTQFAKNQHIEVFMSMIILISCLIFSFFFNSCPGQFIRTCFLNQSNVRYLHHQVIHSDLISYFNFS